ncbi:hypothetical protein E5288_WYG001170 [Bos mutus]|uniref:Uncharacterized protein n=1 Tax=Bos mutus TaxID=72004 RepID=A0A6B0S022_9CETA|nr:hypothetical protein [Bos mutus]
MQRTERPAATERGEASTATGRGPQARGPQATGTSAHCWAGPWAPCGCCGPRLGRAHQGQSRPQPVPSSQAPRPRSPLPSPAHSQEPRAVWAALAPRPEAVTPPVGAPPHLTSSQGASGPAAPGYPASCWG